MQGRCGCLRNFASFRVIESRTSSKYKVRMKKPAQKPLVKPIIAVNSIRCRRGRQYETRKYTVVVVSSLNNILNATFA